MGDKNPNPKLIKLVRHITDRIPGKIKMTTDGPEYWGLACIFEDEMDPITREAALDLMLDMLPSNPFRVRKHWTNEQLHEMNRKKHYASTEEGFDDLLDLMAPQRTVPFPGQPMRGRTVYIGFPCSYREAPSTPT